jgi:Integrase core domain
VAFLDEALAALPFRVTHVLTDRGSCFTADGFEHACERHGVAHRKTRPYTPRTNGMVERFNGRVQREVLGITIYSHRDLETVLSGFNVAYNGRRQRVLKGRSPDRVLRERLAAKPDLANKRAKPPDPDALPRALQVIADPKEVSHPDLYHYLGTSEDCDALSSCCVQREETTMTDTHSDVLDLDVWMKPFLAALGRKTRRH